MGTIVELGCEGPRGSHALRTMFEDRKRVFVDLLQWEVPVLDDRYEFDQFDDEHATYLIVADQTGDHLGSARLLPTTRPHILSSLFTDLCAAPPPSGPQVMEITRFCLSRRTGATTRRRTRDRLVTAIASHALLNGIHTYVGVAELAWLQQILAFGWDCRPLGAPMQLKCGLVGALAIAIGPDTPARLATNGIWDDENEAQPRIAEAA